MLVKSFKNVPREKKRGDKKVPTLATKEYFAYLPYSPGKNRKTMSFVAIAIINVRANSKKKKNDRRKQSF